MKKNGSYQQNQRGYLHLFVDKQPVEVLAVKVYYDIR